MLALAAGMSSRVLHPDASQVQSRTSFSQLYARSGAASFQAFAGKGMSLGQEMMAGAAHKEGADETGGGRDSAAEAAPSERRSLAAAAALARFQGLDGAACSSGDAYAGFGAEVPAGQVADTYLHSNGGSASDKAKRKD